VHVCFLSATNDKVWNIWNMPPFLHPSYSLNKKLTRKYLFCIGFSFVTSIPKLGTSYMLLLIWLSRYCWTYKVWLSPKSPVLLSNFMLVKWGKGEGFNLVSSSFQFSLVVGLLTTEQSTAQRQQLFTHQTPSAYT